MSTTGTVAPPSPSQSADARVVPAHSASEAATHIATPPPPAPPGLSSSDGLLHACLHQRAMDRGPLHGRLHHVCHGPAPSGRFDRPLTFVARGRADSVWSSIWCSPSTSAVPSLLFSLHESNPPPLSRALLLPARPRASPPACVPLKSSWPHD